RGDERTLGTWYANDASEDVVVGGLDAAEDAPVDRAHDARGDEPARVGARQRGVRAAVVVARALRLEREQLFHGGRPHAVARVNRFGAEIAFMAAEPREVLEWNVHAPAFEIAGHVAQDVRQLQGDAEVDRILTRARVPAAEDLHAHEADRGRHANAVLVEILERAVAGRVEVHLDPLD